jgi:tetratricopeptide (TPR) repeat protein
LAFALLAASCQSGIQQADDLEASYDLAYGNGDYRQAAELIQKALDYDDDSARRWLKFARAREALGILPGAASAYQQALDLEPDNIEALERLATLTTRRGDYVAAQRYVEPLLLLQPENQVGLLAAGGVALSKRDFSKADQFAARLIQVVPDRADGYILRARSLDLQGKPADAIPIVLDRVSKDPRNSDLLVELIALYREVGDDQGIRDTATKLYPLFPNDVTIALDAARAYQARGEALRAQAILSRIRIRRGTDPVVMAQVADFWRNNAPPDAAIAEIVRLAETARPPVRTVLARTILDMGRPQTTLALLQPLVRTGMSAISADSHSLFARALLATGRSDDALAKANQILAIDRHNAEALIVRARIRAERRDYRNAATDVQLVLADDSANVEAALILARIYASQGNQIQAASVYSSARQRAPDSMDLIKGEIDWLLGRSKRDDAVDRASGFLQAHRGNAAAWQLYVYTCRRTGNTNEQCSTLGRAILAHD